MESRNYWLDLFTAETWREFLEAGAQVSGFRQSRWKTVLKMRPGDYLLCYLTGVSRWIGLLEVTSQPFHDATPIWKSNEFPSRLKVKPIVTLKPETGVPVLDMKDRLSVFRNLKNPRLWSGAFRGSPVKWSVADGQAVTDALNQAQSNPVSRPVDLAKLENRPVAVESKIGPVTVPDSSVTDESSAYQEAPTEATAHTEIQWLLLKLGNDMGLDVWVARNDKNREWNGNRFSSLPKLRTELPVQFDPATMSTIQLIDVLWLRHNTIVAAFEIESTTSIHSGLLRMSDLISMQPNLNIPLYLVAPDERRNKVIAEVNRPTFKRLNPSMTDICRFVPFSALRSRIKEISNLAKYLKPEFLDEVSESCEAAEV